MTPQARYLIAQAKALADTAHTDRSGLAADVLMLSCKFKIANRCQYKTSHLEYDPTGEVWLPAPSCNGCHAYLDRAYQGRAGEEANIRIKLAILATYEKLMKYGA